MNSKLFIGNLSWSIRDDSLREAFEEAGAVVSATVMMGHDGRSKGCGLVEMSSAEEASAAIEYWNEKELDGRKIFVREDRPREER